MAADFASQGKTDNKDNGQQTSPWTLKVEGEGASVVLVRGQVIGEKMFHCES